MSCGGVAHFSIPSASDNSGLLELFYHSLPPKGRLKDIRLSDTGYKRQHPWVKFYNLCRFPAKEEEDPFLSTRLSGLLRFREVGTEPSAAPHAIKEGGMCRSRSSSSWDVPTIISSFHPPHIHDGYSLSILLAPIEKCPRMLSIRGCWKLQQKSCLERRNRAATACQAGTRSRTWRDHSSEQHQSRKEREKNASLDHLLSSHSFCSFLPFIHPESEDESRNSKRRESEDTKNFTDGNHHHLTDGHWMRWHHDGSLSHRQNDRSSVQFCPTEQSPSAATRLFFLQTQETTPFIPSDFYKLFCGHRPAPLCS